MSRIVKKPITIRDKVNVNIDGQKVVVKGPKGELTYVVHPAIKVNMSDSHLQVEMPKEREHIPLAGTTGALLNNMIIGVHEGFEKKLQLVGVGYKSQLKGNTLVLTLGFSHLIEHVLTEGVTAELPSQTEIILRGPDKQKVGQEAAKIRGYRPPEPYKGKGVRYADEQISLKETKK